MNNWGCSQPPFPVLPALPPGPHPDLQEKPPLPSLSLEEEENRFRRPNVVLRQSPTLQTLATYEAQFELSKQKVLNRKSKWIGRHVDGVPPQHSSSFPCPSPPPCTSHFAPPCRRFPAQQEFDDTDQFYIGPGFSKDDSFFYSGMSHEETNSREPFPSPWKPTFRSRPDCVGPTFFGEPPPQPNYSPGWGCGYRHRWVASPPPFSPNAPHENKSVDLSASPRPSTPEYPDKSDSRKCSCQVGPNTYSRVSPGTSFSAPTKPSSQPNVTERSFLPDIMEGLEPLSPYNETSSVDSSSPTPSPSMVVQKIQHSPVSSSETRPMLDDIGVSESISSNCEETGSDKHGSVPSLPILAVRRPVDTSSLRAVKQDRRSLPRFGLKIPFSRQKPSYKRKRRESESKSLAIGEQPPVPEAPDSQRGPAMEKQKGNLITETLDDKKEKRKAKEDSHDKLHKTKRTKSSQSVTLKESKRTTNPETSTMEITIQEPAKYTREETEAADTTFDCDHQSREAAVSLFSQEFFKEVEGLLAAEEEEEASLAKTVHLKDSSSTSRVLVVKEQVLSSTSLEYLCENIEERVKSSQPEEDCLESVWNSWSSIVEESSSTPKKDHCSRLNNRSGKMFPVSNDTAALWESIDSELRSEALVCPDINSVVASVSPKQFPTPVSAPLLNEGNREQSSISIQRDPYGKCSENVPVRAQSHMESRKSSIFPKKTTKRRNSISLTGSFHSLLSTLCSVGETETRRTRFVRSKQGLDSSTKTVVNDVEGLSSLNVGSGRKIEIKNATEEVIRLANSAKVLYRPKIPAVGSDELGRLGDVRSETERSQNSPGREVPSVKPRAKPKIPIMPTTSQLDDNEESEISAKTALFESSSDVRAIERNLPVSNNNNGEKQSVLGEVLVELQTTVSTSLSDTDSVPDSVQNGTDQQDSCSRESLGIKKQQQAGIEISVEDLASEREACPERGNGKEASICIAPEGSVMESTSTQMEPTNATEAAYCQDENVDLIVVASIANEPKVTDELCISPLVSTSQEGPDLVIGMQPEIGIPTQVLDTPSAPSLPDMLQTSENLDYDELVAGIIDSVMKKTGCNANVELTSVKGKGKYSTLDSRNVHLKEASSSSSAIQDIEESSSNNEDSLHLEPHLLDHSYTRKDAGRESNAKDGISELEPSVTFGRWCGHTQRHLLLNWVDDFDLTGRKSSSVLREDIKEVEEVLVPNLSTANCAIKVDDERTCTEFVVSEKESEEEMGICEETFRNEKCCGFADGEVNPKRQEDDQSNDEQQIENLVVASLIDRELKEIEDFVMSFEQVFEEEKPCSKEDCSSIEPLVATCVEALGEQRIQDQEISRLLAEEGNPHLLSCATNLLENQPFVEAGSKSPSMEIDLSARNLSEETSPSTQEQNASIVPEFDQQEEPEELGSLIPSAMNERENPNEKKEISTTRLDVLNVLGAVGQEQTLLDAADKPRDEANADERDSRVKVPGVRTAKTYFLGDLYKLQCGNTHVETKRKKNLRWTASALRHRSASPVTESSPSPCSQEMCSQRAQKPNRSSSPQKPLLGIEKPVIPATFVESKPTSPDLIHHSVTSTSTRAETNTIAKVDSEPIASPQSSVRWTDNGGFNLSDIGDGEEMLVEVSAGVPPSPRPLSTLFASNVHAVRRRAHSPQVASEKPERETVVSANGLGLRTAERSPFVLRSADGNWFRVTSLEPCRPVSGHKTQKSPVVTSRAPGPKCQREYTCSELDERGKITVSVKELLDLPGRLERDKNIVIIMRGLPGSGKSYAAKLIRAKELSMSGCAPRILSINDYFYFDTVANAPVVKMRSMYPKTWEYRHDPAKETEYRVRLAERFKELIDNSFKRQLELIDDGASILILDDVNAKAEHYEELARFAYYRGCYVLVAECTASLETCEERSRAHQRSLKDIRALALTWEKTPVRWPRLDLGWLLTTQIPFRQRCIPEEAEMVDDSLLLDLHLSNGNWEQEVEDNSTEKQYVETPYNYLEKKVCWADLEIAGEGNSCHDDSKSNSCT